MQDRARIVPPSPTAQPSLAVTSARPRSAWPVTAGTFVHTPSCQRSITPFPPTIQPSLADTRSTAVSVLWHGSTLNGSQHSHVPVTGVASAAAGASGAPPTISDTSTSTTRLGTVLTLMGSSLPSIQELASWYTGFNAAR